jgi:hypothetical protein
MQAVIVCGQSAVGTQLDYEAPQQHSCLDCWLDSRRWVESRQEGLAERRVPNAFSSKPPLFIPPLIH